MNALYKSLFLISNLVFMRLLVWLLMGALFLPACKKTIVSDWNPGSANASTSDSAANTWIYNTMKDYYLWADQMPAFASTHILSKPTDYFYTLLNGYDTIDRFSWIDSSAAHLTNQLNGINTVLGIKYNAFFADLSQTNVVFSIAYVLKGSPAEKAGLKRGDIIYKVDNKLITLNNYQTILQNPTLAIELANFNNSVFTGTGTTLVITKAVVQTNPILKDTVIEWSGKKVAYLSYIQFLSSYDDSLRAVFGRFKQYKGVGIDELVIDLRYNGGGYVSASDVLSTLIVKNLDTKIGSPINKKVYNSAYTAVLNKENDPTNFVTNFKTEANNISNLNRVFILTTNNTASASELIINNLKPFMEVVLIGEHTYGKNVGSFTITDSKNRWAFGLQPITFKITNSLDESNYGTVNGFVPDYPLIDNILPYKAFGDPSETYFNKALTIISPVAIKASGIGLSNVRKKDMLLKIAKGDSKTMDQKDMWLPINK